MGLRTDGVMQTIPVQDRPVQPQQVIEIEKGATLDITELVEALGLNPQADLNSPRFDDIAVQKWGPNTTLNPTNLPRIILKTTKGVTEGPVVLGVTLGSRSAQININVKGN